MRIRWVMMSQGNRSDDDKKLQFNSRVAALLLFSFNQSPSLTNSFSGPGFTTVHQSAAAENAAPQPAWALCTAQIWKHLQSNQPKQEQTHLIGSLRLHLLHAVKPQVQLKEWMRTLEKINVTTQVFILRKKQALLKLEYCILQPQKQNYFTELLIK